MLVTFDDLKDPKTVKKSIESEFYDERQNGIYYGQKFRIKKDHFEEFFGKGVKLKEIAIEMTDAEVALSIESWLPWLPDYYNQMLDGQRYNTIESNNPIANSLSSGAFLVVKR